MVFEIIWWQPQSFYPDNTGTATSYYMDLYSQSGKIEDYNLSFLSLFDRIHQEKYVLEDDKWIS